MKRSAILLLIVLFCYPAVSYAYFDDIEIHGFASTGYLKSQHNNYLCQSKNGCFEFTEFGINFNSEMTDNIRIGMQIYSYDLGDVGNNNVKLDWAFLDYQWREYLGIKVGKFKTPFGLYNEVQDYDMLWVPVLLPQGVYNKYQREIMISTQGGLVYGNIGLGSIGSLRYDLFTGTQEVDPDGSLLKYINTTEIVFEKASFKDYFGSRLKWQTPLQGLILAGTFVDFKVEFDGKAPAPTPTPTGTIIDATMDFSRFLYLIGSLEYTNDDFMFSAEYSYRDIVSKVKTTTGIEITDLSRVREAYYGQVSYRVNKWLETGAYYSVFYQDKNNRSGSNYPDGYEFYAWQKDFAISLRFNITDFWIVKVEEHFINGVFLAEPDNLPTATTAERYGITPGCTEKDWTMFALKTTFSF